MLLFALLFYYPIVFVIDTVECRRWYTIIYVIFYFAQHGNS